jgi:FkbM family methyltransferase
MLIIKQIALKFLRRRIFQSFWQKLFHFSKIGMNYWGGATVGFSGEEYALRYANLKFRKEQSRTFTIFDVGANIGQFAQLAIHEIECPKIIYSFEPSVKTFRELNNTIQSKNLSSELIPHNIGFGSAEGSLTLYSSESSSTIASLYNQEKPLREFKEEFKEVVKIDTIDNFCQINQIKYIDYLKMDIEGHEYQVLQGAVEMLMNNKIAFIQFEFGECQIDSRTFFRDFYLLLHGKYNFFRIVSDGLMPISGYSADLEVYSTANYLAELS